MKDDTRPAIVLTGINLSLGAPASRVHILKDISLNIGRAEAIGLVGPSGSGKSTLLMVMAGLERPGAGHVTIAGQDLAMLSEDELARFRGRNVGIVFQSFHLIPTMTALENVAVPLELAGADDAHARAARELELVGLGERLTHYPAELSGGEQQRVALARALLAKPDWIFLDEATASLDPEAEAHLYRTLKERLPNATLVSIAHRPSVAAFHEERLLFRREDGKPGLLVPGTAPVGE
jgi:putative ABC transport system ATP-binding protein